MFGEAQISYIPISLRARDKARVFGMIENMVVSEDEWAALGFGASAAQKTLARRALRQAGRDHLAELEVTQDGQSSRHWTLDRGWWLINVEFQAPSHTLGTYVNVGLQHLWDDHHQGRFFEYSSRVDIPGYGQKVALVGSEAEVHAKADAAAKAAQTRVATWLGEFRNDKSHLVWISKQRITPSNQENAGYALGLLGKHKKAGQLLAAYARDTDLTWDASGFQREHQRRTLILAALASDPDSFDREIANRISRKREELNLAPTTVAPRP